MTCSIQRKQKLKFYCESTIFNTCKELNHSYCPWMSGQNRSSVLVLRARSKVDNVAAFRIPSDTWYADGDFCEQWFCDVIQVRLPTNCASGVPRSATQYMRAAVAVPSSSERRHATLQTLFLHNDNTFLENKHICMNFSMRSKVLHRGNNV